MPIYEYACAACTHEFETIQKISDEPLVFCPECGKEELAKKISAAAFHLKGTGWYETDFKGKKKSDSSDAKSDSAASGSDSTSGDSASSTSSDSSGSSSSAGSDSGSSTSSTKTGDSTSSSSASAAPSSA